DSGARRSLLNVVGKPIRSWDARGHAFRTRYDANNRLTHLYVSSAGAAEVLLDRSIYGEGRPTSNLGGRLFRRYDAAGGTITDNYDFKGNLVTFARQLANTYERPPDWMSLADLTDPADLDSAAASSLIAEDCFNASTRYDALNRAIQHVAPHRNG